MAATLRRPAFWLSAGAGVLLVVFVVLVVPNYRIYEIRTGSMTPTIPMGSLVIDHKTHNPRIGDVISFHRPGDGAIVTHRLIGLTSDGQLITKGDANPTPDLGSIPKSSVVGHVISAPKHLGAWIHFISHDVLGFVFDGLVLLLMFLVLAKPARKGSHRKHKGAASIPAAELMRRRAKNLVSTDDTEVMTPADVDRLRELLNA